mgnify:FL=1
MNFIDNLFILVTSYLCCKGFTSARKQKAEEKEIIDVDCTIKDVEEREVKP